MGNARLYTATCLGLLGSVVACGPAESTAFEDDVTSGGNATATAAGGTASGPTSSSSGGGDTSNSTTTEGAGGSSNVSGTSSATSSGDTGSTSAGSGGASGTADTSATTASATTGETCSLTCELAEADDGTPLCRCASDEQECRSDADCALANNLGECCTDCTDAYPKDTIASDPCLVRQGNSFAPTTCERPVCTDVLCPAIACMNPVYAACEAGQCVAKHECPDGMLASGGTCVPACTRDSDCVVATQTGQCCSTCPTAYHQKAVEADPCLVAQGDETPAQCQPNPKDCSAVRCPQILCVEPGEAVCTESGSCTLTNELPEL